MQAVFTRTRTAAVAVLAVAITFTTAGIAAADDIVNDVEGTAEAISMNVDGPAQTVSFKVVTTNGDGKNGCNLTGSTILGVSVDSSTPDVVSVSPSSLTFGSCGDNKSVTVTALAPGTTTVSLSQTSNTTGGSFNVAPATFTVHVAPPPNTAPQVTVTGVGHGASYQVGSVPTAGCLVEDAEDGSPTVAPTITGTLDEDGIGTQTAECSYTDAGGLTETVSARYSIVDNTAPVITYTITPPDPDGHQDWYRGNPVLHWIVTENDSPDSLQKSGCVDVTITSDQLATDYTCSATSSGGPADPVTATIKRDGNGPVVAYDSATGTPGANGWFTSAVTATFTATDAFSGVAGPTSATATSSGDGLAVTIPRPAFTDNASNTTDAGSVSSPPFKIDTVKPEVRDAVLDSTPNANGWFKSDVTASFTATDATSGVAGTNPGLVLSGGAQGTVTLYSPQFKDEAGNVTAAGVKSATVNIDTVAPTVSLVGGPADGSSHYFGSVPAAPTCDASDVMSGLDGACEVSGYDTSVGTHTVTATVKDLAGNTSTVSSTYTVMAWTGRGFYSPVDMGGIFNKVKGGSTVPLKFELFAGPTELTSVDAIKSFTAGTVICTTAAGIDEIELVTTGAPVCATTGAAVSSSRTGRFLPTSGATEPP